VREIFSTKRAEIQQAIESELKGRLALDGVALRTVLIGKVDLPADYKRGMETLLSEELASEKMRYTLELKDKRVKEMALDGEAEKTRREKAAEAAAREQVIAARGQEEAMKHVLPFKQRQIEQRQLEAEAEKQSRIRVSEGTAQARRIEASGEADARQRLAEAEVYRLEKVGKFNAEQMEREGALVTRHPLLIQKALADKLSDKVQVIIAAPPADGSFIGANLVGGRK
jgi:regulator of protease activity HflC (stomatin/prohibitin superfamily)